MKEWDEISEGGCKVWEGKGKEMEWEKEGKEEWQVVLSRSKGLLNNLCIITRVNFHIIGFLQNYVIHLHFYSFGVDF